MSEEIRVLDHGFVRLDAHEGGDLSVVNSARVSFAKRSSLMTQCGECGQDKATCDHKGWNDYDVPKLRAEDERLIKFLINGRHGTPFEHNLFRFHVKAPIFVAREWFRHRIGSFNEWSLRYAKVENPDFYVPDEFRTQNGRPGDYKMERWQGNHEKVKAVLLRHYQDSLDLYNYMLDQGIARELARLPLPMGLYTEFYWTVNARSLMNFLSLRNSPQAQLEIMVYAQVIEEIFNDCMPTTAKAFVENGRVAP